MRQKNGVIKEHDLIQIPRDQYDEEGNLIEEDLFIPMQSQSISGINATVLGAHDGIKGHSILDNPVYRKSPFYPFADQVRKKEADIKKNYQAIENLYGKIKQTYKEKMTDQIIAVN